MQPLPKVGNMLRGIFRITKMCDEKFRWLAFEDRRKGLLPHCEINIRRRGRRHDVWAVRDANPSGIPCERDALSLIKIGDMVRGVARSVNDIELSRAHGNGFCTFQDVNVLLGDRKGFAE